MSALSKVSFPGPGLASPAGPVGSKLSATVGAELCGLSSSEKGAPAVLQGRGTGGTPLRAQATLPRSHRHTDTAPAGHGHSHPAHEARRAARLPWRGAAGRAAEGPHGTASPHRTGLTARGSARNNTETAMPSRHACLTRLSFQRRSQLPLQQGEWLCGPPRGR